MRSRTLKLSLSLFLLSLSFIASARDSYWDLDTAANQAAKVQNLQLIVNNQVQHTYSREYVLKLQEIKNNIAAKAGIYPKFLISDSREVNAYATWQDGQPVTIFTIGLLDKIGDDYDATAAVVGHEFSHLTLNHARSSQTTGVIVELLAGLAMIAIDSRYGGANYNPYHGLYKTGLNVASDLTLKAYSRSDELEADAQGVRYMIAAGYSAEGALRLQEHIIPSNSSFFSSHPSSQARIENIRVAMLKDYSGGDANISKPVYVQNTIVNASNTNTYLDDAKYTNYAEICQAQGLNPNSSQFDVCVFKEKRKSLLQASSPEKPLLTNANLPQQGQIGSVISIKQSENYVIFSSSIPEVLPIGTRVQISSGMNVVNGKISKFYDGYYMAEIDNSSSIIQGGRVFINN